MTATWEPVDLNAIRDRLLDELVRVIGDGRVYTADDPDHPGCFVYRYDEYPGDEFDGYDVTDEVLDLYRDGLISFSGGIPFLTAAGRAELTAIRAETAEG